ncbi:hypothetical protein ABK040_007084 [Willaertia magna]
MAGDKPKRPPSSYFLYCADHRDELKQEHSDWNANKIRKELSKMWKEATDEEKEKYKKIYEKKKAEYDKLVKDQDESEGSEEGSEDESSIKKRTRSGGSKKESTKKKQKKTGKRALTAYQLFQQERRPQFKKDHPETKPKDVMSALAKEWKNLTEDEKQEFKDKAEELKKKKKDESEEEEEEDEE